MVDANSSLDDKAFAPFIAKADLCNVIGTAHGIDSSNTHAEGSKATNFILCTPPLLPTIRRSGMLRFYDGIHSDHRGIYCDINILQLLQGEVHATPPKIT
eukprot:1672443-Ditylum_brightwellii.AAC.1